MLRVISLVRKWLLVVVLALPAPSLVGCGQVLSELAEQRQMERATAEYVHTSTPLKIWTAARDVLGTHGFELTADPPPVGVTASSTGRKTEHERSRIDVVLTATRGGHRLELRRVEESRIESDTYAPEASRPDADRITGLVERLGAPASKDGEWLVYEQPLYRVWAETRQELIESGVAMEAKEASEGAHPSPWIDAGDGRTRRVVHLKKRGETMSAVRIEVAREKRSTNSRWEQTRSARDWKLELKVIERLAPSDASKIRDAAKIKAEDARKAGDKIDRAMGEAVGEAVRQELDSKP